MTLLEVIEQYRDLLRRRGRNEADAWLRGVGAHPVVQKAIVDAVDNTGRRARVIAVTKGSKVPA